MAAQKPGCVRAKSHGQKKLVKPSANHPQWRFGFIVYPSMNKKLSLLGAGSVAGLLILINSLGAADATAPAGTAATGAMAPAATSGSMAPPATSGAMMAPAAASGTAAAEGTAANPNLAKLPAPSDKKDLTFDKDIAPILKASCTTCHAGATPRSGLDVTNHDALLKGGKKGKDIVPGHSDQSLVALYAGETIATQEMPPLASRTAHPALTKDQLALVRAWIDQGAK